MRESVHTGMQSNDRRRPAQRIPAYSTDLRDSDGRSMGVLIVSVMVATLSVLAGCLFGICGLVSSPALYAGSGVAAVFVLALLRCKSDAG